MLGVPQHEERLSNGTAVQLSIHNHSPLPMTQRGKSVCVCVNLCSKEATRVFPSINSRGVQSTAGTAPNEAIHLCRKRGLINPVYLLFVTNSLGQSFHQGLKLSRSFRFFMLVAKSTCYRPFILQLSGMTDSGHCETSHGWIHSSICQVCDCRLNSESRKLARLRV